MPNRPANNRANQQPVLSFPDLLSRDSDTVPPDDSASKKFLDAMQVKYDNSRGAKELRRAQASAILWAQVHKDDPGPPFCALPDEQRRQLVAALGLDAAILQKDTWPTVVVLARSFTQRRARRRPRRGPQAAAGSRGAIPARAGS